MATVAEPLKPSESGLPESDRLYEIIYGKRVEKQVSAFAVWIANALFRQLSFHLEKKRLGTCYIEIVFVLDAEKDLRRRPDFALVLDSTWPVDQPPPPTGDWEIIPDLAVEILSPNNRSEDMFAKLREYFTYGVKEVWIVAPTERIVRVYHSLDNVRTYQAEDSLTTELVPSWSTVVGKFVPPIQSRRHARECTAATTGCWDSQTKSRPGYRVPRR